MKKMLRLGLLGIAVLLCTACPIHRETYIETELVSVSGSDKTIKKEAINDGGIYGINFNNLFFAYSDATINIVPIGVLEKARVEVTYSEGLDNYGFDVTIENKNISIMVDDGYLYDIDRFDMTIYALIHDIDMGGGGYKASVNASGISDLYIRLGGSAQYEISLLKDSYLDIVTSGSSNITLSGTTISTSIDMNGASSIKAKNLICDSADINITGVDLVEISVKDSLDIMISGLGTVRYYGNPMHKNIISGSGLVEQVSPNLP